MNDNGDGDTHMLRSADTCWFSTVTSFEVP